MDDASGERGWGLPLAAHCRCGQVAMTVSAPPILTTACHCRGCQRMTGGAYSLSVAIPVNGFQVSGAEPVRGGLKEGPLRHMFCPHCLSWIYTDLTEMGFMNMRAPMLDDPSWVLPFVETQTAERLPGVQTGATISFERFPDMDIWPAIAKRFASEGPRPVS
ncbi:GFA family protein [Amorphus orientalis]|uniref:CENP-V/GFA domain-containing protein n=1 Tax=Amorphus orientalis TaxID=649198 RepID=A0AAE3VR42_9HYPH|nr:GFA family protein [Amorphus orientalis]MDQ0316802.1 hypothetical protein [Amorphus orientalis]